jgi:hypothetical protein
MSTGTKTTARRTLIVLAAVLSAVRYAPVIDDPWDHSMASIVAAVYYGRIEQTFKRFGFGALRGEPHMSKVPAAPGAVSTETAGVRYVHHPVLSYWVTHLFVDLSGWSERAFRLAPILFSSLSAAMLVALVAGAAGVVAGAAALALWLVLPMSFFSGWMANHEPFVLPAMLAALMLHARTRDQSLRKHLLVWIPVFVAGQFDWTGVAIVPAIVIFELLTPRGQPRRLGRAFALALPAAASVATTFALVIWWTGSVGAALDELTFAARRGLAGELLSYDVRSWMTSQVRFWGGMYTVPVSLIAVAALPWLAIRSRSARDPLPRTALALLVPALTHVLLFRDHAVIHDFWWYYALPYAIIATVVVVRDVAARAGARAGAVILAGVVLGLSALAVHQDLARYWQDRTTEFRDRGRDFNSFAGPDDALLYVADFDRSCFYLTPWYLDIVGSSSLGAYAGIRDLKRSGRLQVDRVVALVPEGMAADITPANLPRIQEIATVRRLSPAEFAAEAPAIARVYPGRGLWILTIE